MTKISLYQELLKTVKNARLQQVLKNASGQVLRLSMFANKLRNDTDSILGFIDKGAQVLCSPADYLKALGIGEHDVHGGMSSHNPFNHNGMMNTQPHAMHPHMGMRPPMGQHGGMMPPLLGMRPPMGQFGFNPAMGQSHPQISQLGMMPPLLGMRPPMGQPSSYPGMVGQQGRPPMPQQPMMPPAQMGQPSSYPGMVGQQGRPPMPQQPMMPPAQMGQPSSYPGMVGQQSRPPMPQQPMMPPAQMGQSSSYPGMVGQQGRPSMPQPVMQPAMIPAPQQAAPAIHPQLSITPNMQPGRINQGMQQLGPNAGLGQAPQPTMCPPSGINLGQPGGINFSMLPGNQGIIGGSPFGGVNPSMQQPITYPQSSMSPAQWLSILSQPSRGRAHAQYLASDHMDLDDDEDDLDDEDMNGVFGSQPFHPRSNFYTQHGIPLNQYGQFANQGMFINTQNPYQPYIGSGFAPHYGAQTSHQAYPTQCIAGGQFGNGQNPFIDAGYSAGIHPNGFYPNGTNPGGITPGNSTCSSNLPANANGTPAAPVSPAGLTPDNATQLSNLPANGAQAIPTHPGGSTPGNSTCSSNLPANANGGIPAAPASPVGPAPSNTDQPALPQNSTTQNGAEPAPVDPNSASSPATQSTDPEVAAAEQRAAQLAIESARAAEEARQKASLAAQESAKQAAEERERANQLAEEARKQAAEEQRKAEEIAQQADLEAAEKQRKAAELEKEAQRAAAAIPPSAIDENGVAKVYTDTPPIVSAKTGATEAVVGRDIEETEGVQIVYTDTTTPILVKTVTPDQATALQEHATATPPAAVVAAPPPPAPIDTSNAEATNAQSALPAATTGPQQVADQQQKAVTEAATNAQQPAAAAPAVKKSVFSKAMTGFKNVFSKKRPA